MPKEPQSTGIHIENCTNAKIEGNLTVGFDQGIVAKNVQGLDLQANLNVAQGEPGFDLQANLDSESREATQMKSRNWLLYIFKWLATVLAGLLVAYLAHRFAWK